MKQLTNKFVKTKRIAIMSLRVFIGLFLFTALVSGRPNDKAVMLRGTVVNQDGVGIEGVVVNNGREFCRTDKRGTWKLPTDTTVSKFISTRICTATAERTGCGLLHSHKQGYCPPHYQPIHTAATRLHIQPLPLHRSERPANTQCSRHETMAQRDG